MCYGGVSLAVYTHGITKEIQKLVRASTSTVTIKRPVRLPSDEGSHRETDTGELYFDLLQSISHKLELRDIVEVVAGAARARGRGVQYADCNFPV